MKNLFYLIVAATLIVACSQAPKFTINGFVEGLPDGTVYLKQRVGSESVTIDSAKSVGGKFLLKGVVGVPDMYSLVLGERKQVPVLVENKEIVIKGKADDLKNMTITGSASQDELKALEAKGTELNAKMKELYDKYSEAKKQSIESEVSKLEKQLDSLDNLQSDMMKDFINGNPGSFVAPVILGRIQYGMEAEEIDGYLKKFSPEVMKSNGAKSLAERVLVLQSVAVGKIAPDFTQNDSIDTPIKLSDVYSKHEYTLIDFWASWCGPCRRENPNVVAVWKDFNAKGFHVIGVSYDTDKAKWLKAIASDQLTWSQVSDLKGWSNATAKLYGINSIPSNLLVDKTGKIIAKNLRAEKLRERITELLKYP
jgi:peroxiredoxin